MDTEYFVAQILCVRKEIIRSKNVHFAYLQHNKRNANELKQPTRLAV